MIVQAGRTHVREHLKGDSSQGFTYMALGSSSSAAVDANTTLGTETLRILMTGASSGGDRKARFDALIPYDNLSGTTQEMGIFTGATTGTMFLRDVFTAISTGNIETKIKLVVEIK